MDNETEQRGLLAYHRAQQDAAQRTKAQYEAESPVSGNPEALRAMIDQQQDVIEREQARIKDCLRNLGELTDEIKPDVLIVPPELHYTTKAPVELPVVEDVINEETSEAIPEPTIVDEPAQRTRNASGQFTSADDDTEAN